MTTIPENQFLALLYYLYPAAVFTFSVVASIISAVTLQSLKQADKPIRTRFSKSQACWTFSLLSISYATQVATIGITAALQRSWNIQDHLAVGYLSCLLVFGTQISSLLDSSFVDWRRVDGCFILAAAFEVSIALSEILYGKETWNQVHQLNTAHLSVCVVRGFSTLALALYIIVACYCIGTCQSSISDEECESLLPKDNSGVNPTDNNANGNNTYGTTNDSNEDETKWDKAQREQAEAMEKRMKEQGNLIEYVKGFSILLPHIWPFGHSSLQLRALGVIVCLLISNALHLLVPRQTGIIMDSFSSTSTTNPWMAVTIFAILRLVSSDCGVELIRSWLWTPVKYFSQESLSRAAFSHMMHLSADFHDSKSSSDVLMAVYGGAAISNVLETVLLQAAPMVIDMVIAVIYLSVKFGAYEGFITVATGVIFLHCAANLVQKTKHASRKRRNAAYKEHQLRHAGLLSWQTVSSFNQIGYEDNRHANAVAQRWLQEQRYALSWHVSVALQTAMLTSGLLASTYVAVARIQQGIATPGQFAMLLMYWAQLTSPLQFFARLGKSMSDDFIDAERLLDIMKTNPSVENKPHCRPLKYMAGEIEFSKVCFTYDKHKKILKDLDLVVSAGEKVAFVGATGAGKSTILKLLFRYYDVTGGCIRLDGQDIRDVDMFSLRDRIGIVPQNPVLFDDTILNNVRYSRITATDEEVFDACRAACIHDKILGFTNGYHTKIGERGVKLSGGELQRVAIARAILKRPDIVLLDEATSAVDTETELHIQSSFDELCKDRTTFIVAHRLSTIMNADRIIVLENGEIVEQGSHTKLLSQNGRYASLWSKQGFLRGLNKKSCDSECDTDDQLLDSTAYEATSNSRLSGDDSDSESDGRSSNIEHTDNLTTSDAAKISRLNPVAPEFTPNSVSKISRIADTEHTIDEAALGNANEVSGPQCSPTWSEPATDGPLEDQLASRSPEESSENISAATDTTNSGKTEEQDHSMGASRN